MVSIDIDLDATQAYAEIGAVKSALARIDDDGLDGIDLDLNLDTLESQIESFISDYEDLEISVGSEDKTEIERMLERANAGDGLLSEFGDGSAADGDGPPDDDDGGSDRSLSDRFRLLERRFDFEPGSIEKVEVDGDAFDKIQERFHSIASKGILHGGRQTAGGNMVPGAKRTDDASLAMVDTFFGKKGLRSALQHRGKFRSGEEMLGAVTPSKAFASKLDWDNLTGRPGSPQRLRTMTETFSELNDGVSKFGRYVKKLNPSMQKWRKLLAAVLPLLIAFGVQAGGVAVAMGAVAAAGASVIGLGLVGHGEDMATSWQQAQEQLSQFKEDLFEVAQPTLQQFAPIQAEFFDWAPGRMAEMMDELGRLTSYEDTIFAAFGGIVDWLGELFVWMDRNQQAISELAMEFGAILGENIIDFFDYLLQQAKENERLMVELGRSIVMVAKAVYRLSKVGATLVAVYNPLLWLVMKFTQLLDSKLGVAVLSAAAAVYLMTSAVGALAGVIRLATGKAATVAITNFFATYTSGMASATTATLGLVAAIGLLTGGLALVAGIAGASLFDSEMKNSTGDIAAGGGYGGSSGPGSGYGRGGGQAMVVEDNRTVNINSNGGDRLSEKRIGTTVDRKMSDDRATGTPVTDSKYSTSHE